jgi:hypothetical protein
MDYSTSQTTTATAPVSPVSQADPTLLLQPSTVEDLEKRLAVLKNAGVREYQDGRIHLLFERPQQKQPETEEDEVMRMLREQERLANGG